MDRNVVLFLLLGLLFVALFSWSSSGGVVLSWEKTLSGRVTVQYSVVFLE